MSAKFTAADLKRIARTMKEGRRLSFVAFYAVTFVDLPTIAGRKTIIGFDVYAACKVAC